MRHRALLLLIVLGCGRTPAPTRPVAEEFLEVDYPPPPAQIEEMAEELPGRPECEWLDGHYVFRGRRWQWVAGQWIVPPADCSYEPPRVSWSSGKSPRLYYTPPRWYRTDGKTACQAPLPCLSPSPAPR